MVGPRSFCVILVVANLLLLHIAADEEILSQKLEFANKDASLKNFLQSHPDIVNKYFPNKEDVEEYDSYRESFPRIEDFVIGLLVNPCGANGTYGQDDDVIVLGYDCCVDRFGQGEYTFRPGTRSRFSNGYSNGIPISPDEPLHNVDLVDEYGNEIEYRHSRRADDIVLIDEECVGLQNPHMACIANRFSATACKMKPPCWDHNNTVDATLSCYSTMGTKRTNCMQVSFSQNAFIYTCGKEFANDDRCGTYLEVHKAGGSPYDNEGTILSEVKITTPVTNGMQTTTLPLTYKGDPQRLLCSYQETLGVGSMVRVHSNAPTCCCPPWLSPLRTSKVGAFICPKRKLNPKIEADNRREHGGPFAPALKSLDEMYVDGEFQQKFPFCPALDGDDNDAIMCTQERTFAEEVSMSGPSHYFTRPCESLVESDDSGGLSSADLSGIYNGICPYGDTFNGCGHALSTNEECHGKDHHFSFKDEIGKVIRVTEKAKRGVQYGVSFNDGRSLYWFGRDELEFLPPDNNYEIWFVQRNRFEKTIQKKKKFNVIWPRCTWDSINGRYFPWHSIE